MWYYAVLAYASPLSKNQQEVFMTNKKSTLANLIYSVLLATLLCVIGLFLIVFCVSLFRSGDKPFTRESVGSYLSRLVIPCAICGLAVLFAPAFECIFPSEKKKFRVSRDVYRTLRREKAKLQSKKINYLKELTEARERFVLRAVCASLCTASFVPSLVYLLTPSNFTGDDTSAEVRSAVIFVFACAFASACIFFAFSFFDRKKSEQLLQSVKKLSADGLEARNARRFPTLLAVRIAVFAVGALFLVLGLLNGGNSDVLGKAINICYECIGLG